jgi:phosphate-selective porin
MKGFASFFVAVTLACTAFSAVADEQPPPAPIQVSASSSEGFAIRSASGDFNLQLKGVLQFDARVFLADTDNTLVDNFLIRRARPEFQGTVARYFDFNFTPDFGGGTAVIFDCYLDAKPSKALMPSASITKEASSVA